MALTKIDEHTALVVIDLQKGIAAGQTAPYSVNEVIERAARLAKTFRTKKLPVVLVNVTGGAPGRTELTLGSGTRPVNWAELVPELEIQSTDVLVTKQQWGAFQGTVLDQYLRRKGITQIVLAGIATSIGVESTARNAYELGYNVTLAVDAMSDRDVESHKHSITKIFPRLGETGTTEEIVKLLESRF